jgi:hypothetical protein
MSKGLLEKVFRLVLTHICIHIGIGILDFYVNGGSFFESVLLDGIAYLLHDDHESLTEEGIVFNESHAGWVLLSKAVSTLSLIFLYWMSSDSISMRVISMLLSWNLFLDSLRSCFSFLDSRWRVSCQLLIYSWKACCET